MDENKDFSDCWAYSGKQCQIMTKRHCATNDKCNFYETREHKDERNEAFREAHPDLKYATVR